MTTSLVRTVARSLAAVLASTAAVLAMATPASAAPADCAYQGHNGNGGYGSYVDGLALDQRDWEVEVANAINAYRKANGVAPLTYSRTLARPAMWASLDSHAMGESPSDHVDSRGMDIPTRVKHCSGYTGSIWEINQWSSGVSSPATPMNFWKNSPTHNKIMLDPSHKTFAVGLAYEGEDRHRTHWTVVFGDH